MGTVASGTWVPVPDRRAPDEYEPGDDDGEATGARPGERVGEEEGEVPPGDDAYPAAPNALPQTGHFCAFMEVFAPHWGQPRISPPLPYVVIVPRLPAINNI